MRQRKQKQGEKNEVEIKSDPFLSNPNTSLAVINGDAKEPRIVAPVRILVRPKNFKRPEDMEQVINRYFDDMDYLDKPYTVEGLSLACGFSSVQSLLNYQTGEGYEEFHDLVKMAKLKIIDQRLSYGLKRKFDGNMVIWTVTNNFPESYRRDADNKLIADSRVTSFLAEIEEPKEDGTENKSEAEQKAS